MDSEILGCHGERLKCVSSVFSGDAHIPSIVSLLTVKRPFVLHLNYNPNMLAYFYVIPRLSDNI